MTHTTHGPRPGCTGRMIVLLAAVIFCGLASNARASCYSALAPKATSGSLVRSSVAAIAPTVVSVGKSAPDASGRESSIVGLWRVTFTVGGEVSGEAFEIWHSDGTEVLNDTSAPSAGNVCLGVWEQKGKLTYKLKHPSWTFEDGNLTGTAVIGELIKLDHRGNTFSGTVTIDLYDLDENLIAHIDGQIAGKRITVD